MILLPESTKKNDDRKNPEGAHRVFNIFFASMGACALLGVARGLIQIVRHDTMARGLENLARSAMRDQLATGILLGVFLGLVLIVFRALAEKISKNPLRRRRAYALTPLFAAGIFCLISLAITLAMRGRLADPLASELPVRLVVFRIILPALQDPLTIPRAAVAALLLGLLVLSFALGALGEKLIFRKEPAGPKTPRKKARVWGRKPGIAGIIILALSFGLFRALLPAKAAPGAPDIILISVDTLRADHLGCYGYDRDTSPHMDRLAADGVLVEEHIAHSPWTLPAHISMFTGLRPFEHGVTSIHRTLSPGKTLLSEVLKNRGYRTSAFVTNYLLSPSFGYGSGFDHYVLRVDFPAGEIVRLASQWLEKHPSPAFAFLHLFDPHYPYAPKADAPRRFGSRDDGLDQIMSRPFFEFAKEALSFDPGQVQAVIDRYDEEIRAVDAQLGRFFHKLRSMGRYDNAWIILTSDHGEEFGEHGLWGHSVTLFEEMLRVPLIIKPPGASCAGLRLSDRPIPQKAIFDLVTRASLLPAGSGDLVCNPGQTPGFLEDLIAREPILSESEVFAPHRFSARGQGMKLIEPIVFTLEGFEVNRGRELYDLKQDPGEMENIYASGAAPKLEEIIGEAKRQRGSVDHQAGKKSDLPPAEREKLKALGYLQ